MRSSKKTRLSLCVVALALIALGAVGAALRGEEEASGRVFLANSAGGVLFDHDGHRSLAGACVACHHDLVVGGGYGACAKCHDEGEFSAADGLEHDEILENHADEEDVTCASCHEIAPAEKAQHCGVCHGKETAVATAEGGCTACHDEDEVDYRDFSDHGEMLSTHAEADTPLTCGQCHALRSRSDAYHGQCNDCHLAASREKFADTEGRARCARCHMK